MAKPLKSRGRVRVRVGRVRVRAVYKRTFISCLAFSVRQSFALFFSYIFLHKHVHYYVKITFTLYRFILHSTLYDI